jgi:hypothetical protein
MRVTEHEGSSNVHARGDEIAKYHDIQEDLEDISNGRRHLDRREFVRSESTVDFTRKSFRGIECFREECAVTIEGH